MNHTLLHTRAAARVLGLLVLFSLPACNGNSGGDDDACEPGTERCLCDGGTCNAGLTCLSNVCVQGTAGSGGTAGSSQGGSGGTNTGGTNTGGASGGTGGQSAGGAGGSPAGGAGSGGAATGGSGGISGSGGMGMGGATCENTETDPMNCGQCGRVCRNQDPEFNGGGCVSTECCVGGSCSPYFGECITEASGFQTCGEYCATFGEQCVPGGCRTRTWNGYSVSFTCEDYGTFDYSDQDPCDSPIDWTDASRYVRCCCSDTQP